MKTIMIIGLVILATLVMAVDPPILTDFQQFYGDVTNLPDAVYSIKATVGSNIFTTNIASGKYGYSPTFKVSGNAGDVVNFYVVSQAGVETLVGQENYVAGEKRKDLNFSVVQVADEPAPETNETSATTSNRVLPEVESPSPPAFCRENWDCRAWSVCSAGSQSRTCVRSDSCLAQLEAGSVINITSTPKPDERRSCVEPSVAAPARVCSPDSNRCLGRDLQRCSFDGQGWNTLETCSFGCDPSFFECRREVIPTVQEPNVVWPFYLGGSLFLIIIIGVILFFIFQQKKYAPIKDYITSARIAGASDSAIKSKLVNQGWDPEKVQKMLK
jgi:hypothetical protein